MTHAQTSAKYTTETLRGTDPATGLPVHLTRDRTLRLKVIDACGMTCTFCHNEGTPVVADNLGRPPEAMTPTGRSGRVSIYLGTNGARFLPAAAAPDDELRTVLSALRNALDADELHLTGGEPTLHPLLPDVVALARRAGYTVCATSNGENGRRAIPPCAAAGLDRVNFSIFGTTASELAEVQGEKYAATRRAERKIQALRSAIETALHHGVKASANIVVPDSSHALRVHRLLREYAPDVSVRLLNSLNDGQESIDAITDVLADLRAVAVSHHIVAGASGFRTAYGLPGGRVIHFKQIRDVRLPKTCTGCPFNNGTDCEEGYYGVRLYRDRAGGYQVGVCIQRMDLCMPVEEFLVSPLRDEILDLRAAEHRELVVKYDAA
jgi:molybdenum cofactor biosynthesis enzyme MoaA